MSSSWPVMAPVPRPTRPPTVHTPWGVSVPRDERGFYDGLSWGALDDRCARWREAGWLLDDAGHPYLPAGDRRVLLWHEADGSWSVGHVGADGPGVGLVERVTLNMARARAQAWAASRRLDRAA